MGTYGGFVWWGNVGRVGDGQVVFGLGCRERVWGLVERRCEWVFWVVGGLWRVGAGRAEGVGLKSQ